MMIERTVQRILRSQFSPWAWIPLTVLYGVVVVYLSGLKPLWADEIFTLRIARLASLADIWDATVQGAGDTSPPYYHMMAHGLLQIGFSPFLGIRFPAMAGFWVMFVSLFYFIRRRVAWWGTAMLSMTIPLSMFFYSVEGRSYGLMLGLIGLALVLWRHIIETRDFKKQIWPAFGLAACLSMICMIHYYGCLVLIPFSLVELVRFWRGTRFINPVSVALAVAVLCMVALLPFIPYAHSFSSTFWAPPNNHSTQKNYEAILGKPVCVWFMFAVVAILYQLYRNKGVFPFRVIMSALSPDEWAALAGFFLIPVWLYYLSLYTNANTPRYALAVLPGAACLAALLLDSCYRMGRLRIYAVLFATLLLGTIYHAHNEYRAIKGMHHVFKRYERFVHSLSVEYPDQQFASNNSHLCLQMQEMAEPEISQRFYCILRPKTIDSRCLHDLNKFSPSQLITEKELASRRHSFQTPDTTYITIMSPE